MKKNYVLLCKMRPRRLESPLMRVIFQPEFALGSWLNYERLAPRQRFCTIQRAIVNMTKKTYICVKKSPNAVRPTSVLPASSAHDPLLFEQSTFRSFVKGSRMSNIFALVKIRDTKMPRRAIRLRMEQLRSQIKTRRSWIVRSFWRGSLCSLYLSQDQTLELLTLPSSR